MMKYFYKYKHAIPLIIFAAIYLTWFGHIEKTIDQYQIIHVALDDYIPFCEVFIIPYLLWFFYMAVVVSYFFFKDKDDYYKSCAFLCTGMTVFLLVSTLWPNGQDLRPFIMPRDNVFTRMIAVLYKTDTPTNLWPSIHVYNSIGCYLAISQSVHFEKKKGIRIASAILSTSIILSTMFIKQHSVFDVTTAFIMAFVMYVIVYRTDLILNLKHSYQSKKKRKTGPETL
ncbi:MAG: phosphatase PAP2 family protein [Lachnospiraceae bacterium]|nr:phosphatase PAP2 family protein [Lachnospiraceae bacterium]